VSHLIVDRIGCLIPVLFLFGLGATGCASAPGSGGSSLTGVAAAASQKPEEKNKDKDKDDTGRTGPNEKPDTTSAGGARLESGTPEGPAALVAVATVLALSGDSGSSPPEPEEKTTAITFGVVTAPVWYSGDELERGVSLGAFFGNYLGEERHTRVEVTALFTRLRFTDLVQQSFRDPFELGLLVGARYYFTPGNTLTGVYVAGGLEAGILSWTFQNPVEVASNDGTRQVDSESIVTWTPQVGVGLTPLQTRFVQLGLSLGGGIKLYNDQTLFEAFTNDLFDPAWFYQIGFEVTFVAPK